jgi:hypothetical protein
LDTNLVLLKPQLGIYTHAAAEPSISWRLARVNKDRTPEKTKVKTRSMPMMIAVVALVGVVLVKRQRM